MAATVWPRDAASRDRLVGSLNFIEDNALLSEKLNPARILNLGTGYALCELVGTSFRCRVRCFGLPLYGAMAREALAERLGLLLQSGRGTIVQFDPTVPNA